VLVIVVRSSKFILINLYKWIKNWFQA
jgi:hypothetical protein